MVVGPFLSRIWRLPCYDRKISFFGTWDDKSGMKKEGPDARVHPTQVDFFPQEMGGRDPHLRFFAVICLFDLNCWLNRI